MLIHTVNTIFLPQLEQNLNTHLHKGMDSRFAVIKYENLLAKNLNIKIYRTIILPFVLYGYETWSLSRRFRVFENRVLRRIFGPKSDEATREWRELHNEKLNDLYCSPNIVLVIKSRRMRWAGHVARIGESRGVYMVLVGKSEGK